MTNDRTGDALQYKLVDCAFVGEDDNVPDVMWSAGANGNKVVNLYNSISVKVADIDGNAIENAQMVIRNGRYSI